MKLKKIAIAVLLLLVPGFAMAGYTVQQDIVTLPTGQTVVDVPLASNVVSLDKAFVMLRYFYGHTPGVNAQVNSDDGMVNAYLWDNAGTSTIRFTRAASAVDVAVSWSLVECDDNEFTVYRGSQAWSGTTALYTPAIGATVSGADCLAWVNGTTSDNVATTAVREAHFTADVDPGTQTTLNLRRFLGTLTPNGTLRWVVVEFDPAKIGGFDTGEQALSTEVEAARASFAISGCTKSQSLLLGQWRVSGDDGLNAHGIALNMLNDTTGQAYVHLTTAYARTLRWYCIDFGTGVGNRYEGQIDQSANTAWSTANQTLVPAADTAQALSYVSLTCNGNGTAFPRSMARTWVSDANTLSIARDYTGQGSWIEWQVLELPATVASPPAITAGATSVSPAQVNRLGVSTTLLSCDFTDLDLHPVNAFTASFKIREPDNATEILLVDNQPSGTGGLVIVDNGGGSYTASYFYDPLDTATLGTYDLYFSVNDGTSLTEDLYSANLDELEIINNATNTAPILTSGVTHATPAGVERVGANSTVISASFFDPDNPAVSAYTVSFKLREPDNTTEIVLADLAGNGQSGVTITADGGGNFTASVSWDPSDIQTLGFYDLFFQVDESGSGAIDGYADNMDELQVYDSVSNSTPTLVAGNTFCLPTTVNRNGSDYTMLKAAFSDADIPGAGSFLITFRVMGPTAVETVVVNNASDGQQGLRVTNVGGPNFEASVLWNPDDAIAGGLYDLYFSVTDASAASVADDYSANLDELTVSSTALAGDGYLLKRTHDADSCGGPNSACHNLNDHQGQSCLVCHTAHNTANIYLVKETIQTPNSGPQSVLFKTLGQGDPYNDPDPVPGDATSGTLADDSDGVYTNVCEVCHTTVRHHRNNASTPSLNHHNAEDCTLCHSHAGGFTGGESDGGQTCSCHNEILTGMAPGQPGYHHMANSAPDYASTSTSCLTCHVDHDIFRPDLNVGVGARGSNLRSDVAITPVQGDATVLANSDYLSTGSGGVCISCHEGNDCLKCHGFKSGNKANFNHMWVTKAQYDLAVSAHNYSVPSTYQTDGTVFNANCSKCHNDNMTKSYQNSTETFGLHVSDYKEILDPLGIGTPASPLEEDFCFQCHSTTNNPNSGSNQDYYGVAAMSSGGPLLIESDLAKTSTHPVGSFNGLHDTGESPVLMPRHVECADCHNPHAATADRPPSPALSGALYGVEGVDLAGNRIEISTNSYMVCFKCHGDQHGTTPPVNRRWVNMNTRDEFQPTSQSFHPVAAAGTNPNSPSLIPPWTESSIMLCEDCHGSNTGGARGPHGSTISPILKLRYDRNDPNPENATDYALCYSCHNRSSILADQSFPEHNKHIQGESTACYVCHDAHGVATAGVGNGTHLINFATDVVSNSSSGRLEFLDDGNNAGRCYLTCHGKNHNPLSY